MLIKNSIFLKMFQKFSSSSQNEAKAAHKKGASPQMLKLGSPEPDSNTR